MTKTQTPTSTSWTQRVRAIVTAFDHNDVHLMMVALRSQAAAMEQIDARHPSVEMRADVMRMHQVAAMLSDANAGRSFIEGDE